MHWNDSPINFTGRFEYLIQVKNSSKIQGKDVAVTCV